MRFSSIAAILLLTGISLPTWSAEPPAPPKHMGEGKPAQFEPPARAYDDCKGKKEGDKFQVTIPNGATINLICQSSAKGLYARPEGPPPPTMPGGKAAGAAIEPPAQAYADCKGKKEGDKVTIVMPGNNEKIQGICTTSAKGLFARPEHPIAPPKGAPSKGMPPPK